MNRVDSKPAFRKPVALFGLVLLACLVTAGCRGQQGDGPKVLRVFGRTGAGDGEMIYPRAIALAGDGTVFVADKTGRILHFDAEGNWLGSFCMPEYQTGKPVGLTFGPDGNLYVADTHYYRVLVMTPQGKVLRQIGSKGEGDGQFMFPTGVAFIGRGDDMRMLVSEYGGNDRISVFTMDGKFVRKLGEFGDQRGQFSRPSAMLVDEPRGRLYVADACNHRIAIYDLSLELKGYIGSGGTAAGQMRYPYGLAMMPSGDLVVSEFGNNRLQIFSPDGVSRGILGTSGREAGQLTYPWGLAIDLRGRVFVVDGGNNRIQAWQL
jgi:DNA-binding beta-propeller fold protein YncE